MKKTIDKNKRLRIILISTAIILCIPCIWKHISTDTAQSESNKEEMTYDTNQDPDTDIEVTDATRLPKDALGTIDIPCLSIHYPIYEGAEETQLSIGIGHLPETAPLLAAGNCVLCGHNGSSRGAFFTSLSHIRKGDEVQITRKDKEKRTYHVVSTKVVGPYDASVRKKSKEEILTLFTCAYHGSRRFVAVCEPSAKNITEKSTERENANEVQHTSE